MVAIFRLGRQANNAHKRLVRPRSGRRVEPKSQPSVGDGVSRPKILDLHMLVGRGTLKAPTDGCKKFSFALKKQSPLLCNGQDDRFPNKSFVFFPDCLLKIDHKSPASAMRFVQKRV